MGHQHSLGPWKLAHSWLCQREVTSLTNISSWKCSSLQKDTEKSSSCGCPGGVCSRSRKAQVVLLHDLWWHWTLGISQELLRQSWRGAGKDVLRFSMEARWMWKPGTDPCVYLLGVREEEPCVSTASVRTALSLPQQPSFLCLGGGRRAPL